MPNRFEAGGTGTGGIISPPSYILAQLLVDLGMGVAATGDNTPWQVQCVMEPLDPDQVITVYDVEAVQNGRIMFTGETVEHRGCQIRVRGAKYHVLSPNDGYARARIMAETLDQRVRRKTTTVDGIQYLVHSVDRKSDVIYMGEDTPNSRRKVFTINVTITVDRLTQM